MYLDNLLRIVLGIFNFYLLKEPTIITLCQKIYMSKLKIRSFFSSINSAHILRKKSLLNPKLNYIIDKANLIIVLWCIVTEGGVTIYLPPAKKCATSDGESIQFI